MNIQVGGPPPQSSVSVPSVHSLVTVAGYSAGASVAIVAIALFLLHTISDVGMWAIAAMAAAPSLMGIAIAYFITKHPQQESSAIKSQSPP